MNNIFKNIYLFILLLLMVGCVSTSTKNLECNNLQYGMTETEINNIIKKENRPVFSFVDPEGNVYKCRYYYFPDNHIYYFALFKNNKLCSILQNRDASLLGGFYKKINPREELPLKNEFQFFKRPFFPPVPISDIDFTKIDFKNRQSNLTANKQLLGMIIAFSPWFIAISPVILTCHFLENEKEQKKISLGMSPKKVTDLIGSADYSFGNGEEYIIYSYEYSPNSGSYGFMKNKLIWISNYCIYIPCNTKP